MTLTSTLSQLEKFMADHSPQILTGIGVVGTVGTAVLTGRASVKAHVFLEEERRVEPLPVAGSHFSPWWVLRNTWKLWIPPVSAGALTVTSIILANRIGTRRAAAMAVAYVGLEKAYSEYRDAVRERVGTNKERAVRDDAAQNRISNSPVVNSEVIMTGDGSVLFYDSSSGRYFTSTVEAVKKAMNDLNYRVNNHYYASLSDFYDFVGLPPTQYSEEVGWNADRLMEIEFSTCLSQDGTRPAISINFRVVPIRGYHRVM